MKATAGGVGQAGGMAEQAQTRIWIVDDDPELATMLQSYLEQQGYAVDWHTYPMQHAVCADEVRDIRDWIVKTLKGT